MPSNQNSQICSAPFAHDIVSLTVRHTFYNRFHCHNIRAVVLSTKLTCVLRECSKHRMHMPHTRPSTHANIVLILPAMQILQAVNIDAKTILPEAAKQASVVASLQLKKAYCSGYKDAKHEIAEHCMKTSG